MPKSQEDMTLEVSESISKAIFNVIKNDGSNGDDPVDVDEENEELLRTAEDISAAMIDYLDIKLMKVDSTGEKYLVLVDPEPDEEPEE